MSGNYLFALAAFLGGSVISVINALLTAKQVTSESLSITAVSLIRQVLSIAYLVGAYFVTRKVTDDILWPMIGAAAGLTIPSLLFTITIANHMKGDK